MLCDARRALSRNIHQHKRRMKVQRGKDFVRYLGPPKLIVFVFEMLDSPRARACYWLFATRITADENTCEDTADPVWFPCFVRVFLSAFCGLYVNQRLLR